jgi:hypothetical protein
MGSGAHGSDEKKSVTYGQGASVNAPVPDFYKENQPWPLACTVPTLSSCGPCPHP